MVQAEELEQTGEGTLAALLLALLDKEETGIKTSAGLTIVNSA